MAFDALALQYTVDPETIQPSFLDDNNREIGARARSRLLLEQRKTLQKLCDIAAGYGMLGHSLSGSRSQRGDHPG